MRKTIIFYQHYDTVPADNDQPWTDEPFRLTVRKGYMYGRGVDDDKGAYYSSSDRPSEIYSRGW